MSKKNFIGIDLFSGAGGMSVGAMAAGIKIKVAVEIDKYAAVTYKANHPNTLLLNEDIRKVEINGLCKTGKDDIKILFGGPPCQGFSTAGKRQVSDPRNDLFVHYARLIDELRPKVFIMENVSGMIKGTMKGKFLEILQTLKSMPYEVKAKLMNAKYYGVPQSRERMIFIGVRKDLKKVPVFPVPNPKTISVRDALKVEGYQEYRHNYSKGEVSFKKTSFNKPSLTITKTIPSHYHRGQFDKKLMQTMQTMQTITKTPSARFVMNGVERLPTIEEVLILCSFPSDWKMTGSFVQKWARLGNAVMPKFMQAIAETIKKSILQ